MRLNLSLVNCSVTTSRLQEQLLLTQLALT